MQCPVSVTTLPVCLQDADQEVEVALESADGAQTYARTVIRDVGCSWAKHRATLTASSTDASARLAIRLKVRPKPIPNAIFRCKYHLGRAPMNLYTRKKSTRAHGWMLQSAPLCYVLELHARTFAAGHHMTAVAAERSPVGV